MINFLNSLRTDSNSETINAIIEGYQAIFEMDYKAYHGTSKVFGDFDYSSTGKGTDQLGPGFYFTDSPDEAAGYAGTGEGANIRPAYVSIQKPIILDEDENTKQRSLTPIQISKIMKGSPDLDAALSNFGDVSYEGFNKVFNGAVKAYVGMDLFDQLKSLMNDFFKWDLQYFAPAIKKATGYDGIIKTVATGHTHYVAWFPSQIRSIYK
jgi:hypothetical protein